MTERAKSRAADKRFYGVAPAIVIDVDDPKKEGRVRVKYPWFDNVTESDWCRVCQLYAGPGYGSLFVPENETEVLVGFVQGEMRQAIVLGGLYGGTRKPATHHDPQTDQKLIRTKAGHEILLDDKAGQHAVTVQTVAGNKIVLEDPKGTAGPKVTIETPTGQKIVLDGTDGSVKVTGTQITLDASQVKLGGDAASQPLVLGTAFMALFNAHTHITGVPTLPTGPPVPPMTPAQLSAVVKTS